MLLKEWSFIRSGRYTALVGRVEGAEPRFPDGARITTSRICRLDFGKMVAETLNSTYHLQEPNKIRIIDHNFLDSRPYNM